MEPAHQKDSENLQKHQDEDALLLLELKNIASQLTEGSLLKEERDQKIQSILLHHIAQKSNCDDFAVEELCNVLLKKDLLTTTDADSLLNTYIQSEIIALKERQTTPTTPTTLRWQRIVWIVSVACPFLLVTSYFSKSPIFQLINEFSLLLAWDLFVACIQISVYSLLIAGLSTLFFRSLTQKKQSPDFSPIARVALWVKERSTSLLQFALGAAILVAISSYAIGIVCVLASDYILNR